MHTNSEIVAYVRDLEWAADALEESLREVLMLLPQSTPIVDRARTSLVRYNDLKLEALSA